MKYLKLFNNDGCCLEIQEIPDDVALCGSKLKLTYTYSDGQNSSSLTRTLRYDYLVKKYIRKGFYISDTIINIDTIEDNLNKLIIKKQVT